MFMRLMSFDMGGQVTADGLAGVLAISEDAQQALGNPTGHDLNHFPGQLWTGAVWLGGGLTSLLALQFSAFAGRALIGLPFPVHADEDGKGPVFVGGEGQGDLQREDHEVVAEGEDGPFLGGAQRIVVHAGAPDVTPGFTGQGVVDGGDQDLCAKRQQELEDTAAQIIEVPAGLAEEAMEGAEVFELGKLGGLNNASQGPAPGTENPGAGQNPEGIEARPSEAGLEGEKEWSKGTD
jgi:hypothetical protein